MTLVSFHGRSELTTATLLASATMTPTKRRQRRAGVTNTRDLALGERFGPRLVLYTNISAANAPLAFATCRFSICGWRKGTHDGDAPRATVKMPHIGHGRWFRTDLTTFGDLPSENFKHVLGDRETTDKRGRRAHRGLVGRVAWSDRCAGMNDILGAFSLTTNDVLSHYGNVAEEGRLDLTLAQIIREMTDFCED